MLRWTSASASFAFQSASHTGEPWLGPDLLEAIERSRARDILVCPIGFVADHLEIHLRCAESPAHRASDQQKGLLRLISRDDELRPALRATLRQRDLVTASAQAARWYSLISPLRRC